MKTATIRSGSSYTSQSLGLSLHDYVVMRMRELGFSEFELRRSEARLLPRLLRSDEYIGGIVCGKSSIGHIMLVATNLRVLVIDAKPIYNNIEDITYHVVAGVSVRHSRFIQQVILHTRLGDFKVQTTNAKVASGFKEYIDRRCIEQNGGVK